MTQREHDPEPTNCRSCGTQFDLARQHYYDNLCPTCKQDADGEDRTNPVVGSCHVCGEDVRANESYYSQKAAHPEMRRGEGVLVCPDHRDHRWSPPRPTNKEEVYGGNDE
jgi:hypothetical protein